MLQEHPEQNNSWSCNRCSECCSNFQIVLTLGDLYRIAQYTERSVQETFHEIAIISATKKSKSRENSSLYEPVLILRSQENEKESRCHFLKNKNCEIYLARPLACRTFPEYLLLMQLKGMNIDILIEESYNIKLCFLDASLTEKRAKHVSDLISISEIEELLTKGYLFDRTVFDLEKDTNQNEKDEIMEISTTIMDMLNKNLPKDSLHDPQLNGNLAFILEHDKVLYQKTIQLIRREKKKVVRKIAKRLFEERVNEIIENIPAVVEEDFARISERLSSL